MTNFCSGSMKQLAGNAALIRSHVIVCEQETHFVFHYFALLPNSEQHVFLCQVPVRVQDGVRGVREPRPAGGLPVRLPARPQHRPTHLHPQPLDTLLHLHRTRGVRAQPLCTFHFMKHFLMNCFLVWLSGKILAYLLSGLMTVIPTAVETVGGLQSDSSVFTIE